MTDLLGCPFCGGAPAVSEYQTDEDGNTAWARAAGRGVHAGPHMAPRDWRAAKRVDR